MQQSITKNELNDIYDRKMDNDEVRNFVKNIQETMDKFKNGILDRMSQDSFKEELKMKLVYTAESGNKSCQIKVIGGSEKENLLHFKDFFSWFISLFSAFDDGNILLEALVRLFPNKYNYNTKIKKYVSHPIDIYYNVSKEKEITIMNLLCENTNFIDKTKELVKDFDGVKISWDSYKVGLLHLK